MQRQCTDDKTWLQELQSMAQPIRIDPCSYWELKSSTLFTLGTASHHATSCATIMDRGRMLYLLVEVQYDNVRTVTARRAGAAPLATPAPPASPAAVPGAVGLCLQTELSSSSTQEHLRLESTRLIACRSPESLIRLLSALTTAAEVQARPVFRLRSNEAQ